MRNIRFIAASLALAAVLLVGCRGGNSGKTSTPDPAGNRYQIPEVPAFITDNQEAMDYIVTHYWDKFFSDDRPGVQDTSLVRGFSLPMFYDIFHQYALLLRGAEPSKGLAACRTALDKAEKAQMENPEGTLWSKFTTMYYNVLEEPNSPCRNEEYCIPLLEKLAASPLATEAQRERSQRVLSLFRLNRIGEKAADFAFTLRNGRVMNLYDIDSDYTIIFFSNPGCANCREVMESLLQFPGIDDLIEENMLAVANVYPDEDLGEWIKYSEIYPKNWYNGYDHLLAVNNTPLYNLRAIPSVYLLDREKRVILKDAPTDLLLDTMGLIFGITGQDL